MTVVLGLDPAIGGGNAIIACELTVERLFVLDCQIDWALGSTEAQFEIIRQFAGTYRPSLLIVEADAQQKSIGADVRLVDMAEAHGFRVQPHMTRGQKADPVFGVATMDQSFRRGEISIPWGDAHAQARMGPLVDQLRRWRADRATRNLTQDAVMALWFVHRYWSKVRRAQVVAPAPQSRPSWAGGDPRFRQGVFA